MQSHAVLKDPAHVPFRVVIVDIFPPCDAPTNLDYGIAVMSRDPAKFIQEAATREGEHLFIWLRDAANHPGLTRLPQQPNGDPTTKVRRDSLPDIGSP
jgi:hypothetical protein